jgi:hypothetical protein
LGNSYRLIDGDDKAGTAPAVPLPRLAGLGGKVVSMPGGKRKTNKFDLETRFHKFQSLCRRVINELEKGNKGYAIDEIGTMFSFLKRDPTLHNFLIDFFKKNGPKESLRFLIPLETKFHQVYLDEVDYFCSIIARDFDNVILPAIKDFCGKLPPPEKISRITEEREGAIYKVHFNKSKKTFLVTPFNFLGGNRGGKATNQWKYFCDAMYGTPLNPVEQFRVNKSLQVYFQTDNFNFFSGQCFKFKIPVSRSEQISRKSKTKQKYKNRETDYHEEMDEMNRFLETEDEET